MSGDNEGLSIDVGIITIKPEEFSALTDRLDGWDHLSRDSHNYIHRLIEASNGLQYNVRCGSLFGTRNRKCSVSRI